jgi:hypothetical protein
MTADPARLAIAYRLERAGLATSARTLLGDLPGADANELRRRLRAPSRPARAIYALFAEDATAWAAPLALRGGAEIVDPSWGELAGHAPPRSAGTHPTSTLARRPLASSAAGRGLDADASTAMRHAVKAARALLGAHDVLVGLPTAIDLDLEVSIEGGSLGLAAALAHVCELSSEARSRLRVPVFATGRVDVDGLIHGVRHVPVKVGAALRDLGDGDGLVLVPAGEAAGTEGLHDRRVVPCATLADAVRTVFGSPTPGVDTALRDLTRRLADLERGSPAQLLADLSTIDLTMLSTRDASDVLRARGNAYRHIGDPARALAHHDQALGLLVASRADPERQLRLELATQNDRLDLFDLEPVLRWCEAKLQRPDTSAVLELEVRGTYSRALSLAGRFVEAYDHRRRMMELHALGQDEATTEPRSLVALVLLAARLGEVDAFDAGVARLSAHRLTGVEHAQRAYNTLAIVRGHQLLGRDASVVAWFEGLAALSGALAWRELAGDLGAERWAGHPASTIVRAVARSLRRVGRAADAETLGASVPMAGTGLVAWLTGLVRLEAALATRDLGDDAEAVARRDEARAHLRASFPYACSRHGILLDGAWEALELELDEVEY